MVKFLMRNFGDQDKGRIWVSVPKTLKKVTGAKNFILFASPKFRIFDLFLIRFRVWFCERVTFPRFTVIFTIHLKVLECIFLGGFVFFVFIFVDGLANRGHNRGSNHLYYYKQGFIMHQLVLEILPSSSLIFAGPISSASLAYFLDHEHFDHKMSEVSKVIQKGWRQKLYLHWFGCRKQNP